MLKFLIYGFCDNMLGRDEIVGKANAHNILWNSATDDTSCSGQACILWSTVLVLALALCDKMVLKDILSNVSSSL